MGSLDDNGYDGTVVTIGEIVDGGADFGIRNHKCVSPWNGSGTEGTESTSFNWWVGLSEAFGDGAVLIDIPGSDVSDKVRSGFTSSLGGDVHLAAIIGEEYLRKCSRRSGRRAKKFGTEIMEVTELEETLLRVGSITHHTVYSSGVEDTKTAILGVDSEGRREVTQAADGFADKFDLSGILGIDPEH
jgi:hypothetical protein